MSELLQSARENLVFIFTCLSIFAALVLVAWGAERLLPQKRRVLSPAKRISYIAMFSAVAAVLHILDLPLFFAPSF